MTFPRPTHPYVKVRGRWAYLYRAIDRDGDLVDTMLSEHRDMAAAKAFFRSAKSAAGVAPDRVTTDGHGSHPRAIRSTLGRGVRHRTSAHKNNNPRYGFLMGQRHGLALAGEGRADRRPARR